MTTVHVSASREYDIFIERGLLDSVGEYIARVSKAKSAVIISDDNVFPLYGERVTASLEKAGLRVMSYVVAHGEHSKSLENFEKILNFLSVNHLGRKDALVALGGGVVGDLTGFVASTYQRGMDFVQIPTTLLAAVDSSVGGKTAVNLPTGKNQVGTFYQPAVVLCDPDTLATLPEAEYKCGCAEVIKYAVLGSAPFFEELMAKPVIEQVEHVIAVCVAMKRDIVDQDEFDFGCRQLLNLGHSAGHAVEACSGFTVLHGQAVAIGMAIICRAAVKMGCCEGETAQKVIGILKQYALPTRADYPIDDMCAAILSDKKVAGGQINLIVPETIGRCRIVPVPVEQVRDWLCAGGEQ